MLLSLYLHTYPPIVITMLGGKNSIFKNQNNEKTCKYKLESQSDMYDHYYYY